MHKQFVCLANSKKLGGRCLAGIEIVARGQSAFEIVASGGEPKWIRPVSASPHGEVPTYQVQHIHLLDVVDVDVTEEVPDGYQCENVYFDPGSLRVLTRLRPTRDVLDPFVCRNRRRIFGNGGKAVPAEKIASLDHSLMFVRAEDPEIVAEDRNGGRPQIRVHFTHQRRRYDFPVTDPVFEEAYQAGHADDCQHVYLALSLALEQNGWHSKLIAGVIQA